MLKFTLFWKSGVREVIHGNNIKNAFIDAGYSWTDEEDLYTFRPGDVLEFTWNSNTSQWQPVCQAIF